MVVALHTGRSQRIDYGTVDRLLTYFNRYFAVSVDDLLGWESVPAPEVAPAVV